mmetsp:Transcript_17442/g.21479  ORF Transcript_17442/g.21479 Transcript_17442/m.21479 type:complete len:367 (-) Transcript_17442:313-1413(-)
MMLATFYRKFGGPSVDEVGQLPKPTKDDLVPGKLLLKVHASSLNPADYKQRSGGVTRFLVKQKFPMVYGFDFVGTVVGTPKGAESGFSDGDVVFGMVKGLNRGSLAEYMIVDEEICVLKPENVKDIDAASVPLVGITAVKAFRKCGLREYDPSEKKPRVLVTGGAGGVGSCAIQLAKHLYNASFVATTASPGAKTELVKRLGADHVVNYREESIEEVFKDEPPFDAIFDCVGDVYKTLSVLAPGGGVVSIDTAPTAESVMEWVEESGVTAVVPGVKGFLGSSIGAAIFNRLSGATKIRNILAKKNGIYNSVIGTGNGRIMTILAKEMENDRLTGVIDTVYPLKDGLKAIAHIESGRTAGKIVLIVE